MYSISLFFSLHLLKECWKEIFSGILLIMNPFAFRNPLVFHNGAFFACFYKYVFYIYSLNKYLAPPNITLFQGILQQNLILQYLL